MKSISPVDLRGRNAIITGSTSGIGLAIAQALASAGANITLNGFGSAEEIQTIQDQIRTETGVTVLYSNADISKGDDIAHLINQTKQQLGSVDILVNNAGIQYVSNIETFPVEKWHAVMDINLNGPFHTIRHVFQDMKDRQWGRIINIASAHGLTASPFKSAYVTSKHGLLGLTKVVALEGAQYGITCNAICPGYVWTPLVENQIEATMKTHNKPREEVINNILLARQPTKQFATVEDIGALTLFLCGPYANQITGTSLSIDGGWTAL